MTAVLAFFQAAPGWIAGHGVALACTAVVVGAVTLVLAVRHRRAARRQAETRFGRW